MTDSSFLLAGPNLEGIGVDPWTRLLIAMALMFIAAVFCAMAHEFRLSMKHPPLKLGLAYQIAVGAIFSTACVWLIGLFVLRLLRW